MSRPMKLILSAHLVASSQMIMQLSARCENCDEKQQRVEDAAVIPSVISYWRAAV